MVPRPLPLVRRVLPAVAELLQLLSGDTRKVLDEPYHHSPGRPAGGIIADEPRSTPRRRVRDVLQVPRARLAPMAQPANPLEATTGEATTGAGAHTGGAPAGTAMPGGILCCMNACPGVNNTS